MLAKSKFNSIKTLISQALIDFFFIKNIVHNGTLSNLLNYIFYEKKVNSTTVDLYF